MFRSGLYAVALGSAVSLFAMGANAADMYRAPEGVSYKDAPVYDPVWTGFYAGVNGGYGWSEQNSNLGASAGYGPVAKSFTQDGGFGGGQIGYNWQPLSGGGFKDGPAAGHLVLRIEADIQGSGIEGSATVTTPPFAVSTATGKDELDWFGTVRGRIGYAAGTSLFYFTGGLAFGGVKDTLALTYGSSKTVSKDTTDTGYVLGGGVEHLFSPRWSVKAEYQYIDLGSDTLVTSVSPAKATLESEHSYNTVRLGLNYHFGTSYEPLK